MTEVSRSGETDRLLRIEDVIPIVGIGRVSIYSAMKRGDFPQPVRLSRRCTRWPESAIRGWVESRIEAARVTWEPK